MLNFKSTNRRDINFSLKINSKIPRNEFTEPSLRILFTHIKTKGGFTTSLNQFNLNLNYEKI